MVDGSERKHRVGVDGTFVWSAPVPGVAVAPALTITHPTLGALTPAMTQVAAALVVSAISSDRRTLTVTDLAFDGIAGNRGRGYLVVPNDGTFPCEIVRWDGTTGILADPLPRTISLTEAATFMWADWNATLPAADVTSAVARSMLWTITYTGQEGTSLPTFAGEDSGLLHVVRVPFNTGLTTHKLYSACPELRARSPRAQSGHEEQIEAAKSELVLRLRSDLAATGRSEDGVLGAALMPAHMALTEHYLTEGAKADTLRERYERLYGLALDSAPWVDEDGDGVVDDGETGVALKGPRASSHRGNAKWSTGRNPATAPRFTIGGYR